ncbi:MAG: hypothetical protein JHC28_05375 [Thermoprotei archaeon]|nr:hypothetical protein [Thermoprotei archaeon]
MTDEIERLKNEIINLIDENSSNWIKAAFFSDEVIEVIMEALYSKWESNMETGRPIDYATEDQLKIMLKKAQQYASMGQEEAMRIALKRMGE